MRRFDYINHVFFGEEFLESFGVSKSRSTCMLFLLTWQNFEATELCYWWICLVYFVVFRLSILYTGLTQNGLKVLRDCWIFCTLMRLVLSLTLRKRALQDCQALVFISSCFLWALNFLILRLSQHYFQVQIHTDFHHFTEISQLFHNKHIFNNNGTFQVEIWKMVRTNVFFLQFPVIRCPSMNQKSGKGNFRESKSKKIHRGACPQGPLEACSLV